MRRIERYIKIFHYQLEKSKLKGKEVLLKKEDVLKNKPTLLNKKLNEQLEF